MRLVSAGPADLDRLAPLVAAFHLDEGIGSSEAQRLSALATLLADPRLGAVVFIAESEVVGYIAVAYGFSIEFGGRDAVLDELYLVPEARGRGLARKALAAMAARLAEDGFVALSLEVAHGNTRAIAAYEAAGFRLREKYRVMSLGLGGNSGP